MTAVSTSSNLSTADSQSDMIDKSDVNEEVASIDNSSERNGTEAPAKKKRGACRQITKDDHDDEDVAKSCSLKDEPFAKADAETLAKRKIVKVKRPSVVASVDDKQNDNCTANDIESKTHDSIDATTETSSKSINPFVNALTGFGALTSSSTTNTSSGFSSFRFGGGSSTTSFASTAATATANSSSTSKTSPLSGTGFLTFGAAASAAASITGPALGFGTRSTSSLPAFGSTTKDNSNVFGTSAMTGDNSKGFRFGASLTGTNSTASAAEENLSSTSVCEVFPANVDVSNGEEGEELVLELRTKSFQSVVQEDDQFKEVLSSKDAIPSVPPSDSTALSARAMKTANDENKITKPNHVEADSLESQEVSDQHDDVQSTMKVSDQEKSNIPSDDAPRPLYRWSELGIGPLRLLQHKQDKKARVVQRRENAAGGQGTKLLLNAGLSAYSKVTRPSEKHVQLVTVGTQERAAASFLFKLRNPSDARLLEMALLKVINDAAKEDVEK